MRTLQDALTRADSLRDFRNSNSDAFEKSTDFQDIVLLADELKRRSNILIVKHAEDAELNGEEVHDESW